jgi:hypothetical protein
MLKYLLFPPLLLYASISFAFWGPDCNSAKDCLQKGYEAMTAQKAADYFEEACDEYKAAIGCDNAGYIYLRMGKNSKSLKYYKKGCKMGYLPSCEMGAMLDER